MGKLTLKESEKTRIKQLHGLNGVDLINEQMDAEIKKIECAKKYDKKSEKLTKKGYTKAEDGEDYEKGYKTKTIPNRECEDELWVRAKKEGNMISRTKDKIRGNRIDKDEASNLNNLNSDIIGEIVGAAIGTSGGVNMINSTNWIVTYDGTAVNARDLNTKIKIVDWYETSLNAMKGMIQLAATVEVLNNWMNSNTKDCYERTTNVREALSTLNQKYITGSPKGSLEELRKITRGLNIRNKEIKELKTIVKLFQSEAEILWNAVEGGLGGNNETITSQFKDKARDVKNLFSIKMSSLADLAIEVGEDVEVKLNDNPCSTAMSKTSVKKRKEY